MSQCRPNGSAPVWSATRKWRSVGLEFPDYLEVILGSARKVGFSVSSPGTSTWRLAVAQNPVPRNNAAEAISASKCVPSTGQKYALRVNPSSGNLHPTEFHFFTRGLKGNPDGLYHYDPSRHMAEQRGRGCFEMDLLGGAAPIVFVLTSIVWREAWKYGERAYRYCLHD